MFPGFTLSLALWTLFAPHLDYCCLPGLSLFALPLLDIVRRSSTHACPKDYSVSCPCHTCLLFIDPACIMTMFWNKALHMDPHVSRLVRPVTERSWSNLAIELAQGGDWVETLKYDKDYRGTQPRSNVTKERWASTRRVKSVQLTVAPPNDLDKHKVWCSATKAFINCAYYDNEQITEEPTEVFSVIMHYKINILPCAHPDYDWIGGIEAELHEKQPDMRVVRRGFMRRTRRLLCEPQK